MEQEYKWVVKNSNGKVIATYSEIEWAKLTGRLSKNQKAGAELVSILNEMDLLAHKLYKVSISDGVVSSLRGQLEAYATIISNIGNELTGQII